MYPEHAAVFATVPYAVEHVAYPWPKDSLVYVVLVSTNWQRSKQPVPTLAVL